MKAGVRFETVLATGPGNQGRLQKSMMLGGCRNTISYFVRNTHVELKKIVSFPETYIGVADSFRVIF